MIPFGHSALCRGGVCEQRTPIPVDRERTWLPAETYRRIIPAGLMPSSIKVDEATETKIRAMHDEMLRVWSRSRDQLIYADLPYEPQGLRYLLGYDAAIGSDQAGVVYRKAEAQDQR